MAATSPERFQTMMTSISPLMKQAGFRKRRQLFTLTQHGNVGAIEFQRDLSSTQYRTNFTINLGVWSSRIADALGQPRDLKKVDMLDCHFRERIGFLLDPTGDTWWDITPETDIEALSAMILDILARIAIPTVISLLSDEALRGRWLSGPHGGSTELVRLTYLAILVRDLGPHDRLAEIEDELHDPATKARHQAVLQDLVAHLERHGALKVDPRY